MVKDDMQKTINENVDATVRSFEGRRRGHVNRGTSCVELVDSGDATSGSQPQ